MKFYILMICIIKKSYRRSKRQFSVVRFIGWRCKTSFWRKSKSCRRSSIRKLN